MTSSFENNSAGELFTAALFKAFEKKRVRVITSFIALPAAVFCIRELNSGWYFLNETWLSYLFNVLLFAVVTLCGGALVSSIGSFKRWKFVTGASTAAVLTWGTVTYFGVFHSLIVSTYDELSRYIPELLCHTGSIMLIALGIILTAGALLTRKKERA